ncbi:MAG TPA: arsenate reductase ArsC [Bauldia sp.]|nr:arsenate reductase ArsC [Bauldia sp.]
MPDAYNVLFLCTGNSARSIMAESILRKEGAGRFNAFSAGSHPKGEVNPFALRALAIGGYPVDGLASKSWDAFGEAGAQKMDFIFTVCDDAAGEACPVWPGHPATAHWGVEDPAKATGSDAEREAVFLQTLAYLRNRILAFTALPLATIDAVALRHHLTAIGRLEGAGSRPPAAASTAA